MTRRQTRRLVALSAASPKRQAILAAQANRWLAKSGFFTPMSDAERQIRDAAQSFALRGYYDQNRGV